MQAGIHNDEIVPGLITNILGNLTPLHDSENASAYSVPDGEPSKRRLAIA
jgi:hypothetical protein